MGLHKFEYDDQTQPEYGGAPLVPAKDHKFEAIEHDWVSNSYRCTRCGLDAWYSVAHSSYRAYNPRSCTV